MRLRALSLSLVPVLVVTVAAVRAPAFRTPHRADITAACTPDKKPFVTPPSISMKRADIVEWRSVSPKADSWTITPKDPGDWPWKEGSFSGNRDTTAVTPPPLPSARTDHPYRYEVRIRCDDGTTQTIDPDIIISTGE